MSLPLLASNEGQYPDVPPRDLDCRLKDGSLGVPEHGVEHLEEHQQVQELVDVPNCCVGLGQELLLLLKILLAHQYERVEESTEHEQVVAEEVEALVVGANEPQFFSLKLLIGIWVFIFEQFFVGKVSWLFFFLLTLGLIFDSIKVDFAPGKLFVLIEKPGPPVLVLLLDLDQDLDYPVRLKPSVILRSTH